MRTRRLCAWFYLCSNVALTGFPLELRIINCEISPHHTFLCAVFLFVHDRGHYPDGKPARRSEDVVRVLDTGCLGVVARKAPRSEAIGEGCRGHHEQSSSFVTRKKTWSRTVCERTTTSIQHEFCLSNQSGKNRRAEIWPSREPGSKRTRGASRTTNPDRSEIST